MAQPWKGAKWKKPVTKAHILIPLVNQWSRSSLQGLVKRFFSIDQGEGQIKDVFFCPYRWS